MLILLTTHEAAADLDQDEDGYPTSLDCDDADPDRHPGVNLELCDGKDNNCDDVVDQFEEDADGDGFALCDLDCDDHDPTRAPDQVERPNELDDDCDERVDEGTVWGDDDGDGFPEAAPGDPDGAVVSLDCDDTNPDIHPVALDSATEPDGVDNDCDGRVDEGFADYDLDDDGYTSLDGDCDDNDEDVHPGALELPNGVDDDCDGEDIVVYGCTSAPASSGLWALGLLVLSLRRRTIFALGALLTPMSARAQSRADGLALAEEIATRCAPLRGPGGVSAPLGELGAQANARFTGGWPEAVRSHEALMEQSARTLDLAWSYTVAQQRLDTMKTGRSALLTDAQNDEAAVAAREVQATVEAASQDTAQRAERDEVALQAARVREEQIRAVIAEQMLVYRGFWGGGEGALMWAEAEAAAARGDTELAEQLILGWAGSWPTIPGPPENLFNLFIQLRQELELKESLECACGSTQAAPFLAAQDAPAADNSASSTPGSAQGDLAALRVEAAQANLDAVEAELSRLGGHPLPTQEALLVRARFDALIVDFLSAPQLITPARWAELWWRHGLAALLAGDEDAAWRSLWQAAAVAGAPLPTDALPPSLAALVRQAELEQSRALHGTLALSVSPTATVLVNGWPVGLTFGEAELALPPGLHLVVISEATGGRPYIAVHEVRSGRDTSLSWGAERVSRAESALDLDAIALAPNHTQIAPATEPSWRLHIGPRALSAMHTAGLGGGLGLSHTLGHRLFWADGAGFGVMGPVQRTIEEQEAALVALSLGAAWSGGSGALRWSLGAGAFVHPGFAYGPQTRLAVGWERGALGAELDLRVGWDVADHVSEVPRESLGAGLVMTWRPKESNR